MPRRKTDLAELEERIGYTFRDQNLLALALTHMSSATAVERGNYQRLEFLGDRVLGLAASELLYRAFPQASEGDLSRRFSEVVRRESCAAVARGWETGAYLWLGSGESSSGGRANTAILADVCEAILGAVFLDGGYEAARTVVELGFRERIAAAGEARRDAKTELQEWAQAQALPTPTYTVAEQSGPQHAPVFRIAVKVRGVDKAFGTGSSKRAAEQDAARGLLLREGVWREEGSDGIP